MLTNNRILGLLYAFALFFCFLWIILGSKFFDGKVNPKVPVFCRYAFAVFAFACALFTLFFVL